MGLFKKGYEAVDAERKRQETRASLFRFFITGDNAEADIRFLTDNPVTFNEHTVTSDRNGKTYYDNVLCTSGDGECSLCESGDRPSFKGAYLIWDSREFKKQNGESVKGSVKLYVAGTRILSQIQRLYNKYGLLDRTYTVVRLGEGQNTTYTFEHGDKLEPLPTNKIKEMLPEKLREYYDGTTTSLEGIIERVLSSGIEDNDSHSDTEVDRTMVTADEASTEKPKSVRGILRRKSTSVN